MADPHYMRPSHSRIAFSKRGVGQLLTAHNAKTIKGEPMGWLTVSLFLSPHTSGGGRKTVCPWSTDACRVACLGTAAGMNALPRQANARQQRTDLWRYHPQEFLAAVVLEIIEYQALARASGVQLAVRLNGTSDVFWERQRTSAPGEGVGQTVMGMFPDVQFYDYTKAPWGQRDPLPANYHLTFSAQPETMDHARDWLARGRSVAIVMPPEQHMAHEGWFMLGDTEVTVVDGDLHDLRFLDPAPAVVQLKPKGKAVWTSGLIVQDAIAQLRGVARG